MLFHPGVGTLLPLPLLLISSIFVLFWITWILTLALDWLVIAGFSLSGLALSVFAFSGLSLALIAFAGLATLSGLARAVLATLSGRDTIDGLATLSGLSIAGLATLAGLVFSGLTLAWLTRIFVLLQLLTLLGIILLLTLAGFTLYGLTIDGINRTRICNTLDIAFIRSTFTPKIVKTFTSASVNRGERICNTSTVATENTWQ